MNLSASSLWRAALCPASAVLPHKEERRADSERGKMEHALREAAPPSGSLPEVAFTFNVLSSRAREVGRSIGRNYGTLEEGEIPGTPDLLTILSDHLMITDYKTGNGYAEQLAGVANSPGENLQLAHNALAAATVYDKPRAIVQIIYTKTGEVKDAEFDLFDFAAIRDRLKTIWHRAKVAEVALAMGSDFSQFVVPDNQVQCWRCPAKAACPVMGKQRKVANG